ncbi:MAG TPA: DUF222 domain-containing protein, partial [Acidimicrobiales bacterium]|nr:DUF222 domain-containing protein [Acidimicrobiales bacterium]
METADTTTANVDITTAKENMDRLVGSEPATFNDPQSFKTLLVMQTQLDAFVTKVANQFDTWGEWCDSGCRTPASWVSVETRVPRKDAGRLIKRGRALSQLPECAAALARGEINAAHVDRIMRAWNPRTKDALIRDEHILVEQAKTLDFPAFCRAVDYWEQMADPDGTEEAAEAKRARRDVYLVPSIDGMYFGRMTLDPISGAIFSNELERLAEGLFEEDWKEARARLGFDPTVNDLSRTPAQRRADAAREMATRSATAPEHGRRPAPLFSVLIDSESFCGRTCELAQG